MTGQRSWVWLGTDSLGGGAEMRVEFGKPEDLPVFVDLLEELGGLLLRHSSEWSMQHGLSRLRLDCWDGNPVLRSFYRDCGFTELESVPSHGSDVRLFERVLSDPALCQAPE